MASALALDKQAIRRRFERAADSYDTFNVIQREMADLLVEQLVREPRSILELGCGTGYLTTLLHQRFPQAEIEAVDFAPAMVERARRRVPGARFVICDIEELETGPARYDLIASSATVQWLAEPELTLARLAGSLNIDGELRLTTFGPRTFCELDEVLGELGCERGLRLLSAREWETLLAGAGISRIRAHSYEERFSYPDCAAFLRSVKSSGAGYAPCVTAPGTLAEAIRRYDERFSDGDGVTVTYEIVALSAAR
jgi:malonyl-CoA O-methyltransferase